MKLTKKIRTLILLSLALVAVPCLDAGATDVKVEENASIFASAYNIDENNVENKEVNEDVEKIISELSNDKGEVISLDKYAVVVANPIDNVEVVEENVSNESNSETDVLTVLNASEDSKNETEEVMVESSKLLEDNIGVSVAEGYVNVRKEPSTDSEVLGKLYKNAAAILVADGGDWVQIRSGSVDGYIHKDFLAMGDEAEKIADKNLEKYAEVKVETLKVREKQDIESTCVGLVGAYKYPVISESENWVKIKFNDENNNQEKVGYVAKEYVKIGVVLETAISIEEEQEMERQRQEAERQEMERIRQEMARQEAARQEAVRQAAIRQQQAYYNSYNRTQTTNNQYNNQANVQQRTTQSTVAQNQASQTPVSQPQVTKQYSSAPSNGKGSDVVNFAKQYVGNRYVWGGTSLTNGADCSGFAQSVYKNFGYNLPRTSSSQSVGAGKDVSLNELQPGDLLFYGNGGRVNHVAIYAGDGKIVHAASPSQGITTGNAFYQTPVRAKRVIN